MVTTVDVKKELKTLYGGKAGVPVVVEVPTMNFLMIDGTGDPNTSDEYRAAIQTLYPLAYTLKFMAKAETGENFVVMPLEGLWWSDDPDFAQVAKADWHWTAMIMQPPVITEEMFARAVDKVRAKRAAEAHGADRSPEAAPAEALEAALARTRLAAYDEGRAAQVLYLGPYAQEAQTIQDLHAFIRAQGGTLGPETKHHHEIYLGDPRRTAPEKLRTIIRQPF